MWSPSTLSLDHAAYLAEVDACILEAETSASAQAATIRVLSRTGYDTSEALRALWSETDTLAILRTVRHCLRMR
jgi:hypothetical protein